MHRPAEEVGRISGSGQYGTCSQRSNIYAHQQRKPNDGERHRGALRSHQHHRGVRRSHQHHRGALRSHQHQRGAPRSRLREALRKKIHVPLAAMLRQDNIVGGPFLLTSGQRMPGIVMRFLDTNP